MLTWYIEIKLQLFAIYIYMEEFKKTTFKICFNSESNSLNLCPAIHLLINNIFALEQRSLKANLIRITDLLTSRS